MCQNWVKVVKNGKILTFKVNFLFQKFCYWHFLITSILKSLSLLKFLMTFTQQTARLKNFSVDRLLVLGLKEGLVECATVCVKSEVILQPLYGWIPWILLLGRWRGNKPSACRGHGWICLVAGLAFTNGWSYLVLVSDWGRDWWFTIAVVSLAWTRRIQICNKGYSLVRVFFFGCKLNVMPNHSRIYYDL